MNSTPTQNSSQPSGGTSSLPSAGNGQDTPYVPRPDSHALGKDEGPNMHRMVHAKLGLVASLFYSLHAKHVPTAAHSLRVALCVSTWGIAERLRDRELELVEVAGLLHDIGKIGVPDRVLQKPERLTSDEQSVVALHPQIGVEILRSAGGSSELLGAVLHSGTWFNRLPSSNGKVPFEILAAQMITIADAFDAMTSEQVYRRPLTQEQAIAELFKNSGTQFNPKMVRSFANSITQKPDHVDAVLKQRWLGGFRASQNVLPSQFSSVSMLNLNAAQQSLTSIFRNQLLDTMQDGVVFVDLEGQVLEWNSTAERLTGHTRSSVLQHPWSCSLLSLRDAEGIRISEANCPIRKVMHDRSHASQRLEIVHSDGRSIMVESDVAPVFDQTRSLVGVAMFFRDASEQVNLEQHVATLHEKASKDPLTKAANRAELNRRLPDFVTDHQSEGKDGSLIICDIDFFKKINDTYGHQAGDEALIVFAAILREMTRDSDLVARYGGEEFVILCPGCDLETAIEKAEQIRKELGERPIQALRSICISASFGVSTISPSDDHESLLNRADRALLLAKEGGRNRVVHIDAASPVNAATKKEPKAAKAGWFSWLGSSASEVLHEASLFTNVPLNIAIERLRGFIGDHHAEVLATEAHEVSLKVDSRNLKIPNREGDRATTFTLQLVLSEVEMAGAGPRKGKQIFTVIQIQVQVSKQRDRRNTNLVYQAECVRARFQSFMAAQTLDPSLLSRMTVIQGPVPT